jgi:hypothetical protein
MANKYEDLFGNIRKYLEASDVTDRKKLLRTFDSLARHFRRLDGEGRITRSFRTTLYQS